MKTSEHTFIGHPDKVCDQIADAILDEYLRQDPTARVAVEAMGGHNMLYLTGEITSNAQVQEAEIARKIYWDIYEREIGIATNIVQQSQDIACGVDKGGAGDQGIMIGYATNETPELIPLEHMIVKKISMQASKMGMGPDGKCQVTIDENGKIDSLVVSVQGENDKQNVFDSLIKPVIEEYNKIDTTISNHFQFYFNPTGKFEMGGFDSDSGATGRKIVIDAYGPQIPVGGGSFSGKDPTKVDRSGAYMARRIAVDYLKKYGAEKVLVKLAYVIGIDEPVMKKVVMGDDELEIKKKDYDLRPQAIIERLDLRKPQYFETAKFGSFGRGFIWERV